MVEDAGALVSERVILPNGDGHTGPAVFLARPTLHGGGLNNLGGNSLVAREAGPIKFEQATTPAAAVNDRPLTVYAPTFPGIMNCISSR
jgi:hypothetical protein